MCLCAHSFAFDEKIGQLFKVLQIVTYTKRVLLLSSYKNCKIDLIQCLSHRTLDSGMNWNDINLNVPTYLCIKIQTTRSCIVFIVWAIHWWVENDNKYLLSYALIWIHQQHLEHHNKILTWQQLTNVALCLKRNHH